MSAADFSIIDHCFVPPYYSEGEVSGDPFNYKDSCAYINCGKPEREHLWTVEAYRSNLEMISGGN